MPRGGCQAGEPIEICHPSLGPGARGGGGAVGMSALAVNAVATNGVCWGTRSALATTVSHFHEPEAELELHGFEHNADLIEDQVDVL
jgi:hypothetical protein